MDARRSITAGLTATLMLACSGSTGPAGTGRLTFQIANGTSIAATPTFAVGPDVLTITKVQVVARKIKLERAAGTCPADGTSTGPEAGGSSGGEHHEAADHDCADIQLDPMLLEPPVDATALTVFSIDLPEGSYSELKIQIHRPTQDASDAAFLVAHPDFHDISIKVAGTFNGAPFTFTTPITAEVEIELPKPIDVVAGTPAALTLQVDLSSWFKAEGGSLVSPIQPTEQIRARIEQNIRRSFHAFKDHDHNGQPDN